MDQSRTILVVEDEREEALVAARTLVDQGYRVRAASRWTEALTEIQDHPPDLVLLELDLPNVRGDALLDFIRGQDRTLPVIIVSPEVDAGRMQDLSERGASGFLRKPYEADDLLVVVEQVISSWVPVAEGSPEPASPPTVPAPAVPEPLPVEPGAGAIRTTHRPPPGPSTGPNERRRRKKRRPRGRSRARNLTYIFVGCLVAAWLYWMFHDALMSGIFGVGISN